MMTRPIGMVAMRLVAWVAAPGGDVPTPWGGPRLAQTEFSPSQRPCPNRGLGLIADARAVRQSPG